MRKIENTTGMPVNLIIDELKSDDIRKRIHSVKNLSLIASTIGPDRTKNELIPFVQGNYILLKDLLDDEDEVLIALVESLSDGFSEFLNGQVLVLLPTFEQLCKVEESSVRDKAAIQIRKALSGMSDMKKVEEVGMGIVRRLNENDYYMAKSAVASIIPVLFGMVSPQSQSELLTIYGKMCAEQIPSVRKYASIQLQHLVKQYPTVNDNFIQAQLSALIKDEQDFIRMFVVDSLVAISKTAFHQKNPNFALNLFKTLAEDASWRVRFYFCDRLSEISESLGKEIYRKNFQPYHLKFLSDPEPEMKSIATQKIEKVYSTMETEDILTKFLPILKVISQDQNAFVRNSLAQSVLVLCGPIGKKSTSEMILPIFLTLLKDSDSEVRITLFKKLSLITQVLGVDALSQSVIPALTELAQDKNWRIRSSTIEVLSFFAKAIGPEFLSDKVLKLLLDWMSDKVFSVRQAAVQSTSQLISILGSQWAERNLLQKIWQFQQINNYLHRLTVLFTINVQIHIFKQISSLMSNEYLVKTILPILQTMSKDSVANVRINVCKTITNTQQYYKDRVQKYNISRTLQRKYFKDLMKTKTKKSSIKLGLPLSESRYYIKQMFINQFKLDHLVEKNNECIIYRASHEDKKYIAVQLNRAPLVKMKTYADHFQRELNFLFARMPKPQIIGEFPFKIPQQSETTNICLPKIIEIHVSESHYYLMIENCLEGSIHSQQKDISRVFCQIFEIYDLYYREFKAQKLGDRDFNPGRFFWSNKSLTLIDFGFSLLMKPQRISWVIKLGTIFNQIAQIPQQRKIKSVISILLAGSTKWEDIQQLLLSTFDFMDDSIEPQEIIITPALYQKQTPNRKPSRSLHQTQNPPQSIQTRIIKAGTHNLKDHFDRIKKSLSPGLTNRTAMIRFMESSRNQSPIVTQCNSMTNNYLMNREVNSFEYPIQVDNKPKRNAMNLTYDLPLKETIKNDIISESTYMPTIVEKLMYKQPNPPTRPQTSVHKDQVELPHLKSLLRTSTRDLQSNEQRSFSNTQTIEQVMKKPPSARRNSSQNSARHGASSARSSIQNIQMSDDNSIQQNSSQQQTIEIEHFKMPQQMSTPKTKLKLPSHQINQQLDENYQKIIQDLEQEDQQMPTIVLKKKPSEKIPQQMQPTTYQYNIEEFSREQNNLSQAKQSNKQSSENRSITTYPTTDFQIKVISDQDDEQFKQLNLKIKKYDTIGLMVGSCINHFSAKKNYWIIPLFLCFKRMYSFRKILEEELKSLTLNQKSKELANKLIYNNTIVLKELSTIYDICQSQCKKFDPQEYKKIEKYMNMDEKQDLRDIYFVYLYTQIFKTLQNQTLKLDEEQNPDKYKSILKLQQSTLASVIISEDIDSFNFEDYLKNQKETQLLKTSIQQLEQQVIQLKTRLNSKGIKL